MASSPNYSDLHRKTELQGLHLKARMIVEGYLSGLHRSPHQGYSVEFAQHREYVPGDDLRYVDWKVFGRSDRYYLKQFEEETNFTCHLLIDSSESMAYRSSLAESSKWEYASLLAAALGYLIVQQQDAAGLAILGNDLREFLRAKGTPQHLSLLLDRMQQTEPGGVTKLGPVLHSVSDRINRRGVIILLSDLFDDTQGLELGLKRLRHRKHDVRVLQIVDPAELKFPFEEPTLFHGLEAMGDQIVEPRGLRKAYLEEFSRFLLSTRKTCRDLGFEHYLVSTETPPEQALRGFLSKQAPQPLPELV